MEVCTITSSYSTNCIPLVPIERFHHVITIPYTRNKLPSWCNLYSMLLAVHTISIKKNHYIAVLTCVAMVFCPIQKYITHFVKVTIEAPILYTNMAAVFCFPSFPSIHNDDDHHKHNGDHHNECKNYSLVPWSCLCGSRFWSLAVCKNWGGRPGLIPRPHPLMRRNGLVNQVKLLRLMYTFTTVSPSNIQTIYTKPVQ